MLKFLKELFVNDAPATIERTAVSKIVNRLTPEEKKLKESWERDNNWR